MVTGEEYRNHGLGKDGLFHLLQKLKRYGRKIGFDKSDYSQCYKKIFE